jgi:MSHA pilin protein MshD
VFNIGARASADPMRRKQALAIAEGLMEEVRLARFTFCDGNDPVAGLPTTTVADCAIPEGLGQEANNSRPFDNVSDYAGNYSNDAAGNAFPAGYSATVAVVPDATLGPAGARISSDATPANMNVLRITVTVTYTGGDPVVLDGYRTRYAPRSL